MDQQLLRCDQYPGAAIGHDVRQLCSRAHGVDGNDHGFGAQNRVVRDDKLRTVVQEQRDSIAAFYAAPVLQEAGQMLGAAS